MRINHSFNCCFLFVAALFNSCKEDDAPEPPVVDNSIIVINGKGANIYLVHGFFLIDKTQTIANREARVFVITDGKYTNNSGNNGSTVHDYDDETYFLYFELCSTAGGEVVSGKYPINYFWEGRPAQEMMSFISAHIFNNSYHAFTSNSQEYVDIEFEGENMTINYDGALVSGESGETVKTKINYSGPLQKFWP